MSKKKTAQGELNEAFKRNFLERLSCFRKQAKVAPIKLERRIVEQFLSCAQKHYNMFPPEYGRRGLGEIGRVFAISLQGKLDRIDQYSFVKALINAVSADKSSAVTNKILFIGAIPVALRDTLPQETADTCKRWEEFVSAVEEIIVELFLTGYTCPEETRTREKRKKPV
jgi:hypothetical protein